MVVLELTETIGVESDDECAVTEAVGVATKTVGKLTKDVDEVSKTVGKLSEITLVEVSKTVVGVTKAAVVVTESDNKVKVAVDVALKAKVVDKMSDRINRGELRELLVLGYEAGGLREAFGEVVEAVGVVSRTFVDAKTSDVDTGVLMETVGDALDIVGVVEGDAEGALELITEVA